MSKKRIIYAPDQQIIISDDRGPSKMMKQLSNSTNYKTDQLSYQQQQNPYDSQVDHLTNPYPSQYQQNPFGYSHPQYAPQADHPTNLYPNQFSGYGYQPKPGGHSYPQYTPQTRSRKNK